METTLTLGGGVYWVNGKEKRIYYQHFPSHAEFGFLGLGVASGNGRGTISRWRGIVPLT